ncbi:sterol uptake control protein 2 [Colletotrichum liriopes]|uniref:Sterol uptake control protein 2 n=1 Tax=Colletotrichum liriopes TaxID=708192 RepID=A0AA37LV38_9PEZI|nr:sterol uptake control protein 2 [Colletotrichum liriopes]
MAAPHASLTRDREAHSSQATEAAPEIKDWCGEERPKCGSCIRREVLCEYPGEPQAINDVAVDTPTGRVGCVSPPQSTSGSHSSRADFNLQGRSARGPPATGVATPGTDSGASEPSVATGSNFSITDLALLHHWTVYTSVDVYRTPELNPLWQVIFPQIGFRYPFVAHAILSLSALHLAYIEGSKNGEYVMKATRHHEEALQGFHEVVRHVSVENSEALLAWSLINVLYVFGITKQLADNVEGSSPRLRKDRVLGAEWIPMIRGVDAVLGPTYDYLRVGRMSQVIDLGNWSELDPDDASAEEMDIQVCRARETWKNGSDAEVYEETLRVLRKCRMFILQFDTMDPRTLQQWSCNRAWAGPLAFVHFAPQSYFTLLHQRQPQALILFAFFGALLHGLNRHWFMEGWGKDIVEVVEELLGSYWRPWVVWPLGVVGIN